MRTFFEASWQRDLWSPRMGQSFFDFKWLPSLFESAGKGAAGYFESEAEEEKRRAEQAKLEAERLRLQTLQQQQVAAAGAPERIFGLSPGTALLVGGLGIAAVIGVVMLVKSK